MIYKRRDFLKISGITAAGTIAMPSLLQSCKGSHLSGNISDFLDHFEVSTALLKKVISNALSKGGDYADLYFEHTLSNNSVLMDGKVNQAQSNVAYGVGVRVLKGDQTGYAFTEIITPEALMNAAGTAANIANDTGTGFPGEMKELLSPNLYPVTRSWEDTSIKDKIPFLERANEKIFALDNKVTKVTASIGDTSSYILFYNSEGVLACDYRPLVYLSVNCVMEQNGRIENFSVSSSARKGSEFLSDELVDRLAGEAVEKTNRQFLAGKPKAGEMEVVMSPGESGILLHEAIGHAFEADFNRKNTSIFSDKLNKKIAEDFITIVDDGTLPSDRGSLNFDDEGVPTENTVIVSKGILSSYLHDRISASYYKVSPTGNGRRQSFRYMPVPRMRSTRMENGPHKAEEIIASVKKGIYVDSFSNGQVNIGPGDFTFFVKAGYLIENGKLTMPIKDINIIGNGPQALADITMAADDAKLADGTWTCGKAGQSVPVTMGLPTVKIKKLVVGGINA
ncbi:MAG TPA: metallopeptidase TldD-related protein [Bacteroidales bacterium]|nr:metallopeptidase TldD-related protein [Bacteroidales bacterium]HPJ59034.1 metallopeptidase TldD-related protein [Bacteroidales bacterium]HPR13236.1 metallopeptidase TldD-related protein [Bacteroidales bacterium]HRW84724.1 metallopeptidase TldD-related protein [Bacteroidales bacterium]